MESTSHTTNSTPRDPATSTVAPPLATMTLREFGDLTGTPTGRLYDQAAKDQLPVPVHRIGTRYVLSRTLVDRWLAGEYVRPTAK